MTATVTQLDTARALRVGGSECAAAAGVDPYRSRVMLWAEKTGRIERPESEAMRWGKRIEPLIFDALRESGQTIFPGGFGWRDAERPWVGGTPDALDNNPDEASTVIEVKTSGHWGAHAWDDGGIPVAAICQVQWYLHLTGLDRALIAALLEGQRLVTRTLDRDDALIELLLEAGETFIEYVRADRMPPPDGSDSAREALRTIYAQSDGRTVRFTKDEAAIVRELRRRREQRDAIDRQVAELEQRIQAVMGAAEVAIGPHDEPLARWKTQKRRALNTTLLRRDRPELADLFTTETTSRRFTLA